MHLVHARAQFLQVDDVRVVLEHVLLDHRGPIDQLHRGVTLWSQCDGS
jgi:hypothetical protein